MNLGVVAVFDVDGALLQRSLLDLAFGHLPRARALSIRLLRGRFTLKSRVLLRGRAQVLGLMEQHRRLGHDLVLISNAPADEVSSVAEYLSLDAALSTQDTEPLAGAADPKLATLKAYLGMQRPMVWVYASRGEPLLKAADVAVAVDRRGRLSLSSVATAQDHVKPDAVPKPPQRIGSLEPGPLPYQDGLAEADRVGRVLHRQDIYSSGPPVDAVSQEILDYVVANTGRSVLDVGCGIGPYVDHLSRLGRSCVGIDLDAEAVDAAKRLGRDVRLMSAYAIEFPDDSFDSVILVETLEHLEDYESALAEAARVARDTIVVTVPDISVIPIMSKRLVVPWHLLEATHVNFFTPETLRKTLLRYAPQCRSDRLGAFFEVDGTPVHMHAAAVAVLHPAATNDPS